MHFWAENGSGQQGGGWQEYVSREENILYKLLPHLDASPRYV
jgi:hypothetical protein